MSVPAAVLAAFGVRGAERTLAGGMGESVRAGDVVLKPAGDEAEAIWLAELQLRLAPTAIRTPRPLRAGDGRWVVDGWTAAAYLTGTERAGRWAGTLAAGRALHAALRTEPRPSLLDRRTHRWAHADRVAWGEAEQDLGPLGRRLASRYVDVESAAQLVHCDLSGNVLFHDTEPPAVIDLSLYWRPPAYSEAVVAVDALLWCAGAPDVLDLLTHPDTHQLLLRALVFRLSCELAPDHLGERTSKETWERVADLICR